MRRLCSTLLRRGSLQILLCWGLLSGRTGWRLLSWARLLTLLRIIWIDARWVSTGSGSTRVGTVAVHRGATTSGCWE